MPYNIIMRTCPNCKQNLDSSLFYKGNKDGLSTYCKKCVAIQTTKANRSFKEQCVKYKGGSCCVCGYSKYYGALEFHHIDPTLKDFTIANSARKVLNNKIKEELDKCILLCSNCHKEIHADLINPPTQSRTETAP